MFILLLLLLLMYSRSQPGRNCPLGVGYYFYSSSIRGTGNHFFFKMADEGDEIHNVRYRSGYCTHSNDV